jgi:hypothetical protein
VKKKAGMPFSFEIVLAILVLTVVFGGGIYTGSKTVSNYRSEHLKNECIAIDGALEMYAMAHQSVLTDTTKVSTTGKLLYENSRVYPANLSELSVVQMEFGYFTTAINLSKFSYQTTTASNGKMTYELGVTLPNGSYYTSPRSNK